MKKELLSVSLMCCLLAFQHATPAKAQATGKAGGNRQQGAPDKPCGGLCRC